MSEAGCPFCAIIDGRAPAAIVLSDERVLAFMDLRQAVPGHVLVIPRRHVADIYALPLDDAAAVMQTAVRVAQALRAEYDPPGLNLWQSNGAAAGQEVLHFHLHLHARRPGDGLFRLYPKGLPSHSSASWREAAAQALRLRLAGQELP